MVLRPRPAAVMVSAATGTVTGHDPDGAPLVEVDGAPGYTITATAWPAGPPIPAGGAVLLLQLAGGDMVVAAHLTRGAL